MLVAVGLDRRVATAQDREVLAAAGEHLAATLAAWSGLDGVGEVAVVSTRHRVEIYAASRFPAVACASLQAALRRQAGRDLPLFELHGAGAFRRLVRLASSLEAVVLGDPRILQEVGEGFSRAARSGTAGPELAELAVAAKAAAERIWLETSVGRVGGSRAHAVVILAEKVLGSLAGRHAVLLGDGEDLEGAARLLAVRGATLAASGAASAEAGRQASKVRLALLLREADLVVSAAPSATPELTPGSLAGLLASRRRPLVVVDLAEPGAVEPSVGAVDGAYLCDGSDLQRVLAASAGERSAAIEAAERLVEVEVALFEARRRREARGAREPAASPRPRSAGLGEGTQVGDAPP